MKAEFSTQAFKQEHALSYWRDTVCSTFAEIECRPLSDVPFSATLSDVELCGIHFCKVGATPIEVTKTERLVRRASHDNFMLCIQEMGRCFVEQNGHAAHVMPGDLVLLDSTRPYRVDFPATFRQLVVHLPRSALLGISNGAEDRCGRRIRGAAGSAPMVTRFMAQMADHVERRANPLIPDSDKALKDATLSLIESALRIDECARADASPTHILWHGAMDLMMRELGDPSLSTASVARRLRVSERRLQQVFQQRGESVSRCLWKMRLEYSRTALDARSDVNPSIGDVALMAGFNSFSHFSRSFKAAYGCTPRDYRSASRTDGDG